MATGAKAAYGSLLKIGDGAGSETFTTIGELRNISGPSLSADVVDVSTHASPGAYREKIATLLDAGEITFTVNYIPTTATHNATTGILATYKNRTLRNWQLVFPDGSSTTWSFSGFVTGFQPSEPVDGELSADITITLSGQPTLA